MSGTTTTTMIISNNKYGGKKPQVLAHVNYNNGSVYTYVIYISYIKTYIYIYRSTYIYIDVYTRRYINNTNVNEFRCRARIGFRILLCIIIIITRCSENICRRSSVACMYGRASRSSLSLALSLSLSPNRCWISVSRRLSVEPRPGILYYVETRAGHVLGAHTRTSTRSLRDCTWRTRSYSARQQLLQSRDTRSSQSDDRPPISRPGISSRPTSADDSSPSSCFRARLGTRAAGASSSSTATATRMAATALGPWATKPGPLPRRWAEASRRRTPTKATITFTAT